MASLPFGQSSRYGTQTPLMSYESGGLDVRHCMPSHGFLLAATVAAMGHLVGSRGPSLALLLALSQRFLPGDGRRSGRRHRPSHLRQLPIPHRGGRLWPGHQADDRGLHGQAVELKRIPFDLVSQTVQANDEQRNALEQVHSTANDAAETLSAACPKDTPAELGQRLDQLGRALDAIAASLATLRPALATFYDTLDDEQKARLVAIDFSRNSLPKSDQGERRDSKWTRSQRHRPGAGPRL